MLRASPWAMCLLSAVGVGPSAHFGACWWALRPYLDDADRDRTNVDRPPSRGRHLEAASTPPLRRWSAPAGEAVTTLLSVVSTRRAALPRPVRKLLLWWPTRYARWPRARPDRHPAVSPMLHPKSALGTAPLPPGRFGQRCAFSTLTTADGGERLVQAARMPSRSAHNPTSLLWATIRHLYFASTPGRPPPAAQQHRRADLRACEQVVLKPMHERWRQMKNVFGLWLTLALTLSWFCVTTSGGSRARAQSLNNYRGDSTPVLTRTSYDYVPTIMKDGVYRMWWCGGVAGDFILYAEADSLRGPWHARGSTTPNSYDTVFTPMGDPARFDGTHTCDPSVIRVNGTYYLYYGGFGSGVGLGTTSIGVASSSDGINWTRLNGGAPIIRPARDFSVVSNPYGAGQPSVTHVNGKFYIIYTDTTGVDVDGNGGGQFVLRSPDPTFQANVEELTATGFAPRTAANHTMRALLYAFSVDWQYNDANDTFSMAIDNQAGVIRISLFNAALSQKVYDATFAGNWSEGPGIVSRPDRHAIPSPNCGTVPIDVVRSVGTADTATWNLAHTGVDLITGRTCDQVAHGRVYEGYLIQSPGLPLTLVAGGTRLQFALAGPALTISHNTISISSDVFHRVPYGASMPSGATVLGATARPAAFRLDGNKLWGVDCLEVITANNSQIQFVTQALYDSYPGGVSLKCWR